MISAHINMDQKIYVEKLTVGISSVRFKTSYQSSKRV